MVSSTTLQAMGRETKGKGSSRKLRAAGRIPAVIYGGRDETRSISLNTHELERLFASISIENTVIDLGVDDAAPIRVLVREAQKHPYRTEILHVDFYQVYAGEQVNVELPVRVVGTPVGVREGGILDQMLHELPVRCDVDKIPDSIEVDISSLAIGDAIHVRDLTIPAGVQVEVEEDRVVCSVTPPTVAALEEEPEAEVAEGVAPELIGQEEVGEE